MHSKRYVIACMCLALSRFFQVLSFFVPLKVIILAGSQSVPSYFTEIEEYVSYEALIRILLLSVPFFYAFYMMFGVFYRNLIDKDYKHRKACEVNVEKKVVKGREYARLHGHFSKSLSEIMIMTGSVVVIVFLDVYLAFAMIFMLILPLFLFSKKVFGSPDDARLTWLNLHKRQYIEYVASGCFIVFFGLIVVKAYYGESGVFELIFALLLSRQVFQALQRMSAESIYIAKITS